MASVPFKVKAIYEYNSPHDDDLSFPVGQVITVTEEEDTDWYVGEYLDSSGTKKDGLFPRNFVEKYEPQAPPRPTRTRPPKDAVPAAAETTPAAVAAEESSPAEAPAATTAKPVSAKPEAVAVQETKPPPEKASKAPPPTAAKPSASSFKDRIAAFNKPSAAPIAPAKPGGLGGAPSTGFIKKPFVAPPPSRNAYVPPPKQDIPQKIYRREEDPEIHERQQEDQEEAERAGLTSKESQPVEEGEEAPKTTSLKDRIALLQKQQQEAAARRAELSQKEKPPRPPKGRQESLNSSEEPDLAREESAESLPEGDTAKPALGRKPSREPRSSVDDARDIVSDGNEADQSGAGDETEDGADDLTEVDEALTTKKTPQLTPHPPTEEEASHGVESDEAEDEEGEETEEQAEARRKEELRARMAKMSGGMGMAGMFGPPGGAAMPMPASKKKAPAPESATSPSTERAQMIAIPGMGAAPPVPKRGEVTKESEPAGLGLTERPAEEVPDVEDVEPDNSITSPQDRAPPPVPSQSRPQAPTSRAVPPPPTEARGAPPPPPRPADPESDDDEVTSQRKRTSTVISPDDEKTLPTRGPPPPVPGAPPKRNSGLPSSPPPVPSSPPTAATAATATTEKRTSRVPPIPIGSPQMLPHGETRAPPPPPPTAVPSRSSTMPQASEESDDEDGESEYEGDYDTDIASGATHKDALKANQRDSIDESTLSEDTSATSPSRTRAPPPPVPSGPRAAPPPPPPQAAPGLSRQSTETGRAPPPPARHVPIVKDDDPIVRDDDDDYDPYRYSMGSSVPPGRSIKADQVVQESDPNFYSSPPPRGPPPQIHAVPPPLPPQHQTLPSQSEPRKSREVPRQSMEAPRSSMTIPRHSMEQARPSMEHGQIAADLDLAPGSLWWSQASTPPPALQGRSDVFCEYEESSTSKRGGRTTITRDVYAIFQDYSQTTITARFDSKDPNDVTLEQRHEPAPARLRQDQLEAAYDRYGPKVANAANGYLNQTVGDGSAQAFVYTLLASQDKALLPVGTRGFGALVFANLANATVQQYDEIRSGDIVSFRNAKFQGKHGAMHQKYSEDVGKPDHVGVVVEWDGTKKKIRALEQGRDGSPGKAGKVKVESFKLGDLRSGEVKVWRVMGRDWVGWE